MPILSLTTLPRVYKKAIMIMADLIALPICFILSVVLRMSFNVTGANLRQLMATGDLYWNAIIVTIAAVILMQIVGLYRSVLSYFDFKTLVKAGVALLTAALGAYFLAQNVEFSDYPRSSIIIFWFIAFTYITCSRVGALMLLSSKRRLVDAQNVAIFGAGDAGAQMAVALKNSVEYLPVCFFDDDVKKHGTVVAGLSIYSPKKLQVTLRLLSVSQVVVAMPSASTLQRKAVVERLSNLPDDLAVTTKVMPSLSGLVGGQVEVNALRAVDVADLLGRDAVAPMPDLFAKCIKDKVVMVTGAGGSIGSELCRQILSQHPKHLVLLELNEFALYTIEQELAVIAKAQNIQLTAILACATNAKKLDFVFTQYGINTLYHAAAYKHVPLVEHNPCAAVLNNIKSTLVLAETAKKHKLDHFVLISTDKAVRPTNVMGATKRVAEQVMQAYASKSQGTVFCMVRFGNVLGSSGSVIPRFLQQIAAGGPVTVTDKNIIRYFMLIPEAAQLVIQAGAMAQGGEVYVLDMGEPVRIYDLAKKLIYLSGHNEEDIKIEITGLREGEKLYEELLIGENSAESEHPRVLTANELFMDKASLLQSVEVLLESAAAEDVSAVLLKLKHLVPEFNHNNQL